MIRAAIVAALLPGSANADSNLSCAILSGFTLLPRETGPASFDLPFVSGTPECTRSLELGGKQAVTCGWAFGYRSGVADKAFEDISDMVGDCARFRGTDPSTVSHPDSYSLRQYLIGSDMISVSLKDKAGLNQTMVFLRTTATN